jgi:hypothetical protein
LFLISISVSEIVLAAIILFKLFSLDFLSV